MAITLKCVCNIQNGCEATQLSVASESTRRVRGEERQTFGMISLLEKEARDPVEVLRVKLKDSTDTSLLNSQLLQEIKYDYQVKQDSTKGQLDAFVQAHVDDIERASTLLEVGETVNQIVKNLEGLSQNCRKMNEELGEKKLSSGISIARRNLKELENQIVFYEEMPAKVREHRMRARTSIPASIVDTDDGGVAYCVVQIQELHQIMDARLGEVVSVYTRWQTFDDWRQKMLQEVGLCEKKLAGASFTSSSRVLFC